MFKAFKYRLYPNKSQAELINKHIGAARFVYNLALETKESVYKASEGKISLTKNQLSAELTLVKKDTDWMYEINSQSLQAPLEHLETAFKRFFNGTSKFPRYKSKWRGSNSFSVPQNVEVIDNRLLIPKFKSKDSNGNRGIKLRIDRKHKGEIRNATISRSASGKYFVSILCETKQENRKCRVLDVNNIVGVDLGLKDFLITSKGEKVDNPKYLRTLESKLKYIQRRCSKYKGKKNKLKLQKAHEKVKNQRKDFLQKLSTKLVRDNHSIAIEDLNIAGLLKNHCLAKSISDVGWSMFIDMLRYKCKWYGVNLIQIGRFDPSSKRCHLCKHIKKDLTLKDRNWTCDSCGVTHDRDINAAINIMLYGIEKYLEQTKFKLYVSGTDTKTQNELPALVGVMTSETHSIGCAVGG